MTDNLTSDWLPGGAAQTLHGRHAGRVSSFYADQFGRWVSQTLQLKNKKKITIITAYRPYNSKLEAGTKTIVTQQAMAYQEENIYTHLHKQFTTDLTTYIQRLQLENHKILLALDANLVESDLSFTIFLLDCKLVDIFFE